MSEQTFSGLPEDIINKAIRYDRIVERRKVYQKKYLNKVKDTDAYKQKQIEYRKSNIESVRAHARNSARKYYNEGRGKEQKQEYYQKNKAKSQALGSFNYYKKRGALEKFRTKFPDRYQIVLDLGKI